MNSLNEKELFDAQELIVSVVSVFLILPLKHFIHFSVCFVKASLPPVHYCKIN